MNGTQKLWEPGHSYYCSDSSWTESGAGEEYDSWASFFEEYGTVDKDYNLLFRWDWSTDEDTKEHKLKLFFMQQRKGRFVPVEVVVTEEDEPAIREYLTGMWNHLKSLWEPVCN
jgi:uncharacterized protein YndB with AHSA1/START domain